MPPKQRVAFCNLSAYLGARHPDLHMVFESVCEADKLSRGNATLIIPPNAKQLAEKVWSGDEADIRAVRDQILSHVLYGVHRDIGTSKDATTRQDPPRAIKLVKKGDSIVVLSGANSKTQATVEPASDFVDSSTHNNIDVWVIKSGEIAVDGPAVDIRKRGPGKVGGASTKPDETAPIRAAVVTDAIRAAIRSNAREAFCCVSRGIACHINRANPVVFRQFILPHLAHTFYDLFFLLEPYKRALDEYKVDSDYIAGWDAAGRPTASFAEYMAIIDDAAEGGKGALIYNATTEADGKRRYKIERAIAAIRTEIVGKANIVDIIRSVEAVYSQLEGTNTIPGIEGSVFPEKPVNKLDEDDFRFWTDITLSSYFSQNDANGVNSVLAQIREFMAGSSKYVRNVVNSTTTPYLIFPIERTALVRGFVHSIFFLSYPLASCQIDSASNYQSATFGAPDTFYNPLLSKALQRRPTGGAPLRSAGRTVPSREKFGAALRRAGVELTDAQLEAAREAYADD